MATASAQRQDPLARREPWTFNDLLDLDAPEMLRYEVVDGSLVVSPRSSDRHEDAAWALLLQMQGQEPPQWQVRLELSVALGTDGRIADLGLLRRGMRPKRDRLGRSPANLALLVEVVSPSSRKTDRLFKPLEYAAAGIQAYWRLEIDPTPGLFVYRLVNGTYQQVQTLTGAGRVEVPFPFELDIAALLPEDGPG